MKKSQLLVFLLCSAAVMSGSASLARADNIDYGSLESLFGEPITTSATGTPLREKDVPVNMTIITSDQIRQSGSRSIPEVLRRIPGLNILRESSVSSDVGVRGYQQAFQPRLLVLIDGRQVFLDDYSRTAWDDLPVNVDDIRQIEVVMGPSSALFGSNAAGGVVNIVTYSPLYDDSNVVSVTVGTQHTYEGDTTVTGKLGKWGGLKLSAGGMMADEFKTTSLPAETPLRTNPMHNYLVESALFQPSSDLQLGLETTYTRNKDISGSPMTVLARHIQTDYSVRGTAAWQTNWGLIKSNNYLNHSDLYGQIANDNIGFPAFTSNLIVSQLEDQFKLGNDHTLRAEVEYRRNSFHDNFTQALPQSPNIAYNNYAASGTWLWQVAPELSFTNATRFDHLDLGMTGPQWADPVFAPSDYSHAINQYSLNSGIVYQPTYLDTFRATYGRGLQMPSLLQYGFNKTTNPAVMPSGPMPGVVLDMEGNPTLKPTIVTNYELGYDRSIPDLLSTAKFSVFYQMNQDVIAPGAPVIRMVPMSVVPSGMTAFMDFQNLGNSKSWGGEMQLVGNAPEDGFRWDGSYSLAIVTDSPGVAQALSYDGSFPQHTFRLLGGYSVGNWEMDTFGMYVTDTNMVRNSAIVATGGYASLSGRVGYKIDKHFTLSVSGTDLTSNILTQTAYPAVERQVFLTLTGRY